MMVPRLLVFAFQTGRRSFLSSTTTTGTNTSRLLPLQVYFSSASAVSSVDTTDDVADLPRLFGELQELHPLLKANIVHDAMTEIQAKTYDSASQGVDVLGRARTGTGKTVGFLLPAMQRLLSEQPREKNGLIRLLVLSPTRELAAQIESQVRVLAKKTGLSHQVVFGGSSKFNDINQFERKVPNVLVATPGRLKDHLQTTMVKGQKFASLVRNLDILVLDETDRYVLVDRPPPLSMNSHSCTRRRMVCSVSPIIDFSTWDFVTTWNKS
jgi:DEAD/DEAH box helicase